MAIAYDFYSPFMSAGITDATGTRYPLWTNLTGISAVPDTMRSDDPFGLVSMPFLSELQVDIGVGYVTNIRATFAPPFQDARKFINSELIEWGVSIIDCTFGYSAGTPNGPVVLSPAYTGVIQKPDISIAMDVSISLQTKGAVPQFSMIRQEHGRVLNGVTRMSAIQTIVAGPDPSNPRNVTVDFSGVGSGTDAYQRLTTDMINLSQGNHTDNFQVQLLLQDCQCQSYMVGGQTASAPSVLYVFDMNTAMNQPPLYTFNYFDLPNIVGPIDGIFPILNIDSPSMVGFLPGWDKGHVAKGITSEDRMIQPPMVVNARASQPSGNATFTTVTTQPVGGGNHPGNSANNPGLNPNDGGGGVLAPLDPNDPRFLARLKAKVQTGGQNSGLPLEIETLGVPDIVPGAVITINGIGRKFDGNYGVWGVTHYVGANGYRTRLSLRSNSEVLLAAASAAAKAAGTPNDQPASDPSTTGVSMGSTEGGG